ncbi:MAG: hypothetical protein PF488_01150 [Patescibacteria group bacterium]|jgi:hypothetical protein|nr:hypothetical protein [Patescibacteria group bacterium]
MTKTKKIVLITVISILSFLILAYIGLLYFQPQPDQSRYPGSDLKNLQKCDEICHLEREVESMDCRVGDIMFTIDQYCFTYYDVELNE